MGVKKLIYENVGLSNVDPTAKLITAMERHNQGVFGEEICFAHGRWQLGFSLSAFAVDLIRNLKDQKSEIQELWLDFSLTQARLRERPDKEHIKILVLATRQLLDVISSAGKTLDRQIPVKKLSIQALGHKPLLQILPLLNPVTLKTIEIQKSEVIMAKKPLNLNKVVQLDQWKNAEEVLIKSITAPGQIQHFLHFVVAEVNLESISMGDVLELKNVSLGIWPTCLNVRFFRYSNRTRTSSKSLKLSSKTVILMRESMTTNFLDFLINDLKIHRQIYRVFGL